MAIALGALFLAPAFAPQAADGVPRVPSPMDTLPDIEARSFDVRVAKRSKSAKTYLFEDVASAKTRVGKILLARRDGQPMMAFRVVKTYYPAKNEFAAKQVRNYRDVTKLEPGDTFSGLEKVADVAPPPPTAQDRADLKELEAPAPVPSAAPSALPSPSPSEADLLAGLPAPAPTPSPAPTEDLLAGLPGADGAPAPVPTPEPEKAAPIPTAPAPEVQEYDPELDAAASPAAEGEAPEPEEDDDDRMGVSVEETHSFDVHRSWLSAGLGYYQNVGPLVDGARGSGYFAGAGVRYGYSLGKEIFLRTSRLQDSLVAELGVSIYKIVNFETNQNDSYSVLPLTLTARYNILFSENFGIFFYTGVCQNVVFGATNTTGDTLAQLRSLLPAAGGGLFFRIGPSWHVRVDAGYDMIGAGLSLRF